MKKVAILAALAAITLTTAAQAAPPRGHNSGDPIKNGKYCWVYTSSHGAGWWDECDPNYTINPRGKSLRGRTQVEIDALENGSGGDSGGGSGGGGSR